MSEAYGIDFGTTNSVLARATSRGVEAIPLDGTVPVEWADVGFEKVLPSVIGFRKGEPVFGWSAKKQTRDRLEAVKRLFAKGDVVTIGSERMTVEVAAAMFFRHIQERAAAAGLTSRLDRAVVTIPANSRGVARYRTKLSAGLAGIEVMALINEPTAAAMAYAHKIGQDQRILVFDWGGGTLDVTVLESRDGAFIEQSSKGIQRLGGLDVDELMLRTLFPASDGWPSEVKADFRLDLELAKIRLSTQAAVNVAVPDGGHVEITRGRFEEAIMPLIQQTREPVEVCLRESPGRIDHLVMVGGSSAMPVIQRFVGEIVGIEPRTDVDPMTAIAEGAAIAAGILQGSITDLDFYVGSEHALGVVVHNRGGAEAGEFSVLIPRNTKYPARATDTYLPTLDFQETVNLKVIEGDPDKPIDDEDNVIIKDWDIELPEKRLRDDASFDVTYEYDVDGILHVLVRDRRTGNVMMDEELAFGAATDRSQLPAMRRRVDGLMDGHGAGADGAGAPALSPDSATAVRKASKNVIPFVPDDDRELLERLVAALESAAGSPEEDRHRTALETELRKHAYLL